MIRIAAVGDVHVGTDCVGCLNLAQVDQCADLLLFAGDLTRVGDPDEAMILAAELRSVQIPIVAVLGNHDYHRDQSEQVVDCLTRAGVQVLQGASTTLDVAGTAVAVVGTKGFGGGFAGACASEFGEPEMKAFVRHTKSIAADLETQLRQAAGALRIVLLHYSPIESTLQGERLEIYPFLGSYLLGEAIDRAGADLVFHGHAHNGIEKGVTPSGVRVRNVAKPVIGHAFKVYTLGDPDNEPVPVLAGRDREHGGV